MNQEILRIVLGDNLPAYSCHLHPTTVYPELQLVIDADLYWQIAGRKLTLKGCFFWVNYPEVTVQYGPEKAYGRWHHRYVVLAGSRPLEWLTAGLLPREPILLRPSQADHLATLFDKGLRHGFDIRKNHQMRAAMAFEQMLLTIQDYATKDGPPPWLEKVAADLADLQNPPDYNAIAADCRISLRTLQRQFRQWFDMTMHDYYRKQQMETAKVQLLRTNRTTADIAQSLNFSDAGHFSHTFSRYVGMSPSTFRKTMPPQSL